ncbi:MAG: DsbA family protein [Chloroflexota bacterium]
MTKVAFYFDPLCPWAWLTSLWAREVREHREIEIEWKFFSLAEVNELGAERNGPLRIAAQARRERGNEGVDRAYLGLGRLIHEQRFKFETLDELQDRAGQALSEVGLDAALADRALADGTTLEDVLTEHRHAVSDYATFGVPWVVLDESAPGFFGPVIGERFRGEQAAELWDHFKWIDSQPALFELKRGRAHLPKLHGLSEEFVSAGVR